MGKDTTNADKAQRGGKTQRRSGFSDEDRAKAREARKAREAWAKAHLRRDFPDNPYWLELARQYGVRLPQWWLACTTGGMRRWLLRLGFSVQWYREWMGERALRCFIERNPDWPLRAFVGLLLEEREAEDWRTRTQADTGGVDDESE